jgi:hypothetical protein
MADLLCPVLHPVTPVSAGLFVTSDFRLLPSDDLLPFPSPIVLYLSPSVQVLSAHSSASIEEVASIGPGVRFFQLYVRFCGCAMAFSWFILFSGSGIDMYPKSSSRLQSLCVLFTLILLYDFPVVIESFIRVSSLVPKASSPALRPIS